MQWIFIAAILAAFIINSNYGLKEKFNLLTDDELEIRQFNKCPSHQYFEIFKSECMDCAKCRNDEFVVYKCSAFDNTICSTCDSLSFRYTAAYMKNCKNRNIPMFGPYRMRDGMTNYGITDKETPFKIITNEHLSALDSDENEVNDLVPMSSKSQMPDYVEIDSNKIVDSDDDENDVYSYSFEDDDIDYESEELELMDFKPLLPVKKITNIDDLVDDSDSDENESDEFLSSSSSSEEDEIKTLIYEIDDNGMIIGKLSESELNKEREEFEKQILKAFNNQKMKDEANNDKDENSDIQLQSRSDIQISHSYVTAADFLNSIKLALISFIIVAIIFIIVLQCVTCCNSSKQQRVFTIIKPPQLSPEEENELIRSLDYVKSKRQFKYQPLEEFV